MKKPTSIKKTPAGHTDKAEFAITANTTQALALACAKLANNHWLMANVANLANSKPENPGELATLAKLAISHGTDPVLALACTTGPSRGTICTKAKAPVCEDTLGQVVAAPTVSGVLSCLNSWGLVRLHGFRMVYGRGGSYPQGRSHGLSRVFNHHAHHLRVKTHLVVLKSRQGATMHRPTVASRSAAPVSQAAPANTTPTSASTEAQAFALLQAVTSTNLAGFYLRRDNVAQARRKLRQALQALNALEVAHA